MKKKMQTSKKLMWILLVATLLNSLVIEGYSMWVMFVLGDSSALSTLISVGIGTPVTLAIEYAIYSLKAYFENRDAAQIEFEREKLGAVSSLSDCNEEGVG